MLRGLVDEPYVGEQSLSILYQTKKSEKVHLCDWCLAGVWADKWTFK